MKSLSTKIKAKNRSKSPVDLCDLLLSSSEDEDEKAEQLDGMRAEIRARYMGCKNDNIVSNIDTPCAFKGIGNPCTWSIRMHLHLLPCICQFP